MKTTNHFRGGVFSREFTVGGRIVVIEAHSNPARREMHRRSAERFVWTPEQIEQALRAGVRGANEAQPEEVPASSNKDANKERT